MIQLTRISAAVALAIGSTAAGLMTEDARAQQTQQLERVEVTGSSIRRVDAETSLPVQIITREEIARSGVQNTEQLLSNITTTSTLGGTQLSTGAGSSTYGVSTVSLRGLQDFRTLVLVNGRRLAPFAGGDGAQVNISAIPIAAIERVEVLKDGASSIYGSDAIAGVVNFILTRSYQGLELGLSGGTPTRSGGVITKASTWWPASATSTKTASMSR